MVALLQDTNDYELRVNNAFLGTLGRRYQRLQIEFELYTMLLLFSLPLKRVMIHTREAIYILAIITLGYKINFVLDSFSDLLPFQ